MIILDTNVLSEFMRPTPDQKVMEWTSQQLASQLFITSIAQAEVYYGLELLPEGKRRKELEKAVHQVFEQDFRGRILPFDCGAAKEYGVIVVVRKRMGKPISQADAQISAIVRHHKAMLATRNISDFMHCEITLINPWLGS